MAFYNVHTMKNFSVNNPANTLQQQVDNLEEKIDTLSSAVPSLRLFFNYPEMNHDYFNQPSNIFNLGLTATSSSSYEETIVAPRQHSSVEMFATIPTNLVLANKTILAGDVWKIQMWIKTSQQNVTISFPISLYQSLGLTGATGSTIKLTDDSIRYTVKVGGTAPILHTFEIPIITTVAGIQPTTQLFCVPELYNDGQTSATVQTYFGGETCSFLAVTLGTVGLPPNQSWIYSELFDENISGGCFKFSFDVEEIPFAAVGNGLIGLHSENYFFTDMTAYFEHLSRQNINGFTGSGLNSYIVKISDVYNSDNYGMYQVGFMEVGITGPDGYLYSVIEISPALSADGIFTPRGVYSFEIVTDWVGTGAIGPWYVSPPTMNMDVGENEDGEERKEMTTEERRERLEAFKVQLGNKQPPQFESRRIHAGIEAISAVHVQKLKAVPLRSFQATRVVAPKVLPKPPAAPVLKKVDYRSKQTPVIDQGYLGSCTACSLVAQYGYVVKGAMIGSPLFLYYNERKRDGTVSSDAGSTVTSGIASLRTTGLCSEAAWPYVVSKFTVQPPTGAYGVASGHVVTQATKFTNTLANCKKVLDAGGCFTFGFLVYTSFMSTIVAKTGVVPMPKRGERLLGGHAVTCVGYDDTKQMFIVKNSWGTAWGDVGYFYMPYAYMSGYYSWDFWTINAAT